MSETSGTSEATADSKDSKTEKFAAALADWESATVKNLDPLVTKDTGEKIWAAILANRTAADPQTFANELARVLLGEFNAATIVGAKVIEQLRTLIAAHAASE